MDVTKETLQRVAALVGIPLPDQEAAALVPLQAAAVQNLARFPAAALLHVEPPMWFRPLPAGREGQG